MLKQKTLFYISHQGKILPCAFVWCCCITIQKIQGQLLTSSRLRIISHVPQGLAPFIVGEFYIDMSLSTQSSRQLRTLMLYYGFQPTVQEATHRQGGHLDNIFINVSLCPLLDVVPKYYTDNMYITILVPLIHLHWFLYFLWF